MSLAIKRIAPNEGATPQELIELIKTSVKSKPWDKLAAMMALEEYKHERTPYEIIGGVEVTDDDVRLLADLR